MMWQRNGPRECSRAETARHTRGREMDLENAHVLKQRGILCDVAEKWS